jgi:hypothetical protein
MDGSIPTIGPGNMEVCQRCVEHLKHDVDRLIADELERHPEILNGNARLHDMLKMRRGQRSGFNADADRMINEISS